MGQAHGMISWLRRTKCRDGRIFVASEAFRLCIGVYCRNWSSSSGIFYNAVITADYIASNVRIIIGE
jgi:hypothetical protein